MSKCTVAVSGGNITIKHYGFDDTGTAKLVHSFVRAKVAADDLLVLGVLPASLAETYLSNDW